jgi:ankyrin repeat protein
VQLLLERGANIEATDKFNDTALVRAAREGKIEVARLLLDRGAKRRSDALNAAACFDRVINSDISQRPVLVKLLLEKGAGIDARNKDGLTALVCAKQMQLASVVDLLEQAGQQRKQLEETQSNDPRVAFATYLSLFQRNPHDDFVREKILQIAPALAEPPAIPEEARQLFVLATDQIKQAGTPAALDQPIALLRKAMEIAPWWSNAYYNLSRALEMRGQYDDAIQQLNYYLKLTPPAADASEARAHLIVIQALRDTAAHK